jgi:hypothetical protein
MYFIMLNKLANIFLKQSQLTNDKLKERLTSILNTVKESEPNYFDGFSIIMNDNIFIITLYLTTEDRPDVDRIYNKVAKKILFQQDATYANALKNRVKINMTSPGHPLN